MHGAIIDIIHLDYLIEMDVLEYGDTILPNVARNLLASSQMPQYLPSVQEGFNRAQKDMLLENKPTFIAHPSYFLQKYVSYMSVPTLVGHEFKENRDIIRSFAECTGDSVKSAPFYILFPRFMHPLTKLFNSAGKKHTDIMEKYVEPVVQKYRGNPNFSTKQSFIKEYSLFRDKNGGYLPARQVAHSIILVAFASVHTTSRTVSITLYWLLARPELLKKALDEIKTVFPNNEPVTYESLEKVTFLSDVIKEVLRQSVNNLGIRKRVMKDYTYYNGYQIPKGRLVQVTNRQLSFGLNMNRMGVDEMDPSKSMQKPVTTPARDFVSFGAGRHLCPGRFFATQEVKFVLIEFLRNYDIKVASGKRPVPYRDFLGMNTRNCEDPLIFTPRKLQ